MNREAERKRLVELIKSGIDKHESTIENYVFPIWEFLADHLLDNGIVVPPVKVGDMAYFIIDDEIDGKYIESQRINDVSTKGIFLSTLTTEENCNDFEPFENIGKTVFTSREEAVKALRKEDEKK